ncbi:ketohexokinase-like [Homalodisca vitripennis]|uniref:ketohexokinase-like n=1 Tax=Homalodisca vitripennis TaxID=197043 RepID=UPI001EEC5918|nr:ketohexokinase-like [Homalodisca vitripennis]
MSDDMLGRYAVEDFEKHKIIIKNVVKHRGCDCPFSSVLINAKNGSRTIVHSNKNLPELTIEDFRNLDLEQYKWIHFEGRNVRQVVLMLKYVTEWNSAHSKIVTSVELEKPKDELKELLPLADVVFVGKDFASFQGCKNKYDAVARNIALVKPK